VSKAEVRVPTTATPSVKIAVSDEEYKKLKGSTSSTFLRLLNVFFQEQTAVDVIGVSSVTLSNAPVIPMVVQVVGLQFLSSEGTWACNYLLAKRT
jgi:hypothetical protein